jgi:hypothetical protein
MRAMSRRQATARIALLAMAFAALLPFSAAARMLLSDGPVEHCHRLSIDAAMDTDPAAPEGPGQPRKGPCPFCASAPGMAPPAPLPMPGFVALDAGAAAGPFVSATPFGIEVEIPLSRAPPAAGRW